MADDTERERMERWLRERRANAEAIRRLGLGPGALPRRDENPPAVGRWSDRDSKHPDQNTSVMEQITIRLREETIEELEAEAEDAGVSRSEHVRNVIGRREDVDRLRRRIEQLEEQLARRSQVEERVDELALELREGRAEPAAPWPVRWVEWWRSRDRSDE